MTGTSRSARSRWRSTGRARRGRLWSPERPERGWWWRRTGGRSGGAGSCAVRPVSARSGGWRRNSLPMRRSGGARLPRPWNGMSSSPPVTRAREGAPRWAPRLSSSDTKWGAGPCEDLMRKGQVYPCSCGWCFGLSSTDSRSCGLSGCAGGVVRRRWREWCPALGAGCGHEKSVTIGHAAVPLRGLGRAPVRAPVRVRRPCASG